MRPKRSSIIPSMFAVIFMATGLTPLNATSGTLPLPLKLVGTRILNSRDEPVRLRGVNTAGLEWSSDGEGHILETVRVALEDWHVNVIRLPLSQDRWFGRAPEQTDEGRPYRALVDRIVTLCASHGAYIILDLHWSNTGRWGQDIGQHSMPDPHSVTFWQDLAPVYANHPAVLYDLYNEPHDVTWDIWLQGGTVTDRPNQPGRTPQTFEAVGMQTLLDTVRSAGARNVVVAGGLDWAYDFSGILDGRQLKDPHGNGVIYANHVYDNKGQSVFTWIANLEAAAARLPVIVSEFGGSGGPDRRSAWWGSSPAQAMGDDWLLHVIQAIHDHQWSFTAWDLHPAAGPTLIADWDYTPTPDFGVYVKRLIAGTGPGYQAPDPAASLHAPASPLPESARQGGAAVYGDWQIAAAAGRRQLSILSFYPDADGRLMGQWITFRDVTELQDVRYQDNQVSFVQTVRFGPDQYHALFTGTLDGDRLSGTLSHGAAQTRIEGGRTGQIPWVAGPWELTFTTGDRDATARLDIKSDPNGRLTGVWQGEPGDRAITDIRYEQDKLSFKLETSGDDPGSAPVFTGSIHRDTEILTGVLTSQGRDVTVRGKRIESPLAGNWILEIQSPRGPSRQRLKIYPDLNGMYGIYPIEAVSLDGDTVHFRITLPFGRRRFDMNFTGKLSNNMLTGNLTAFRGTQKVTGKRLGR